MNNEYVDNYIVPDNWKSFFFQKCFAGNRYGYVYLLVDVAFEGELLSSIDKGVVPDYAVILEAGAGEPDSRTRFRMERYYGFKFDEAKLEIVDTETA